MSVARARHRHDAAPLTAETRARVFEFYGAYSMTTSKLAISHAERESFFFGALSFLVLRFTADVVFYCHLYVRCWVALRGDAQQDNLTRPAFFPDAVTSSQGRSERSFNAALSPKRTKTTSNKRSSSPSYSNSCTVVCVNASR